MLNEEVKNKIINELGYYDRDNVLYGMNYMKLKAIIPLGTHVIYKYDQMLPHLFVFENKGIAIIRLKQGKLEEVDFHLFIPWEDMQNFKIRNGLMTYKMTFKYNNQKYKYQLNKFLAIKNNEWVKANAINLKAINFNQDNIK